MGTPRYRLRLLGSLGVESNVGKELDLSAGKPMALLAYLVLVAEPVSRGELARLLWPDSPTKRARGSLRQALWQLRRLLGEEAFAGDDPVALREGVLACDVIDLRAALAEERLDDALSLWQGAPMADLHIADAPEWERWAEALRSELEARLGSALADRGQRARHAGSDDEAVRWLQWARDIQPDRLRHNLDLAEVHADRRAFEDAVETLAETRRRFDDPEAIEEVAGLEERLRALQKGTTLGGVAPGSVTRLQFTGRAEEFAALARGWRQACGGSARVALVTGDAGIGKTRLAEEIALLARSEGGRVVRVKAEDTERPIEWGLLGELVDELLRLSGAAGISAGSTEVLRTVVPSIPQGSGGASVGHARQYTRARPSAALADALQDLVAAVAEDAPLFILVDDLQWADAESRAVVTRVATRLAAAPIFFLTNSRSGAGDVSPRMRKTLQLLTEAAGAMAVTLRPLSREEIRELLQATLTIPDGVESERIVERIIRTSRGNPLFIAELLKVLLDRGIVTESREGALRLRPERVPGDLPLPLSLRELIDRQLLNLPQDAALVAAHLAHSRHPVPPRSLATRAGLGQESLTAGISELVQRRMVHWEGGERLAFAHDELRAAVARRFRLHVGLTTGGGAQWSLFRSAVVASLVLLLASTAAYVLSGGTFRSAPPLGGGPLLIVMGPDSLLEARAPLTSPAAGWVVGPVADSARATAARASPLPVLGGTSEEPGLRTPLASAGDTRVLGIAETATGGAQARVVRPDGSLVDARTWDRVHGASWCGGTPPTLLLTVVDSGETRLVRWDPDGASVSELSLRGAPGAVLACSPDGRYGAILAAEDGTMRVRLLDFETGATFQVPVPDAYAIQGLRWENDRPVPVPVAVSLEGPSRRTLDWGERIPLQARLEHSDGSTSNGSLVWRSRDPGVASVTSDGLLTANRPGTTTIEVSFDGWLADSLQLQVREAGDNPRVLLWDRVPPLGDDLWVRKEGRVVPEGELGDAPVPAGRDEGSSDGFAGASDMTSTAWFSSDGYSLPAGGTLEVEFRLLSAGAPLRACLVRAATVEDLLARGDPITEHDPAVDAALCLTLHRLEGGPGDAELHFHPSFPPIPIAMPPEAAGAASRWHHAGLGLLPDGTGVAYLDGAEAARAPIRLPLEAAGEWRVFLDGLQPIVEGAPPERAFRNVLLWPDIRF